jgi:hypothetical protein
MVEASRQRVLSYLRNEGIFTRKEAMEACSMAMSRGIELANFFDNVNSHILNNGHNSLVSDEYNYLTNEMLIAHLEEDHSYVFEKLQIKVQEEKKEREKPCTTEN